MLRFVDGPLDGAEFYPCFVPQGGGPYHIRFMPTSEGWMEFIEQTPYCHPAVLARYNQDSSDPRTYRFKRYEWINQDPITPESSPEASLG